MEWKIHSWMSDRAGTDSWLGAEMDGGAVEGKEMEKELQLAAETKGPIELPRETMDFFGNDERDVGSGRKRDSRRRDHR
jgi:hypothetical protein